MKSVLHIIYHARFGGIEQVVYDILKHQASTAQQAQDLLILKTEGEYLAQFGALPITVHHGAFKSGLDFAPSKILFIKEIIKSYDLVHFHMFHLPAIAVAVFSGTKTIYTEHGNFGFGRKVRWTDRVNHFFKGVFLRKKTNFITYNSNFTQAYAQKKYRLSHGRQSVVYNGIAFDNASTTTSRDFTANANTFNVGTISRLAGFKRVDRLISAFAEFALSKNDVKLYIGGDGVLKKALENQVRELNMEDKIKFTGYLKNATDFMEQMNVCIFPSQNEPFGIVAVESLSRERPTLVFADGGGLVEIVGRFRPENIVPDEQALISRLEHYFENRGIVNNETAHIKKTLRDEFSIATMCASLHKIYSSLQPMCGINGLFNTHEIVLQSKPHEQVKQMNAAISHRGPDDSGIWESTDRLAALGHQRLSILDLSSQGHQPMVSENGRFTITFNGEIYNFEQLKKQYLSEEQFHSQTDTEVVLKLYAKFGKSVPSMLNGMFAFAIWDSHKQELFLTRDRSGKKPLYITHQNGIFAFSSEIKALLALNAVDRSLDHEAFYHFLTFSKVPAPFTCFDKIEKVEPASYLLVTAAGVKESKTFWRPEYKDLSQCSADDLKDQILTGLDRSVKDRLLSDVPLGAFLSGGVDSSAIVALMRQQTQESIDTFSIGFEEQPQYDELRHANHVSQLFNTRHHEKIVTKNDLLAFIPTIVNIFDEPLSDTTSIPIYFLSEMAMNKGIKVVLTGDGADELFAGYRNFMKYDGYVKYGRGFNALPTAVKKLSAGAFGKIRPSSPAYDIVNRLAHNQEMIWVGANGFKEVTKRKLLGKAFDNKSYDSYEVVKKFKEDFDQIKAERQLNHIDWMCYMGYRFAITDHYLFRADRLGMKHGIEIRSPFLDYQLINLALSIPSGYKIKSGEPKYILKKALEPLLSQEILYRKKQGFNVPIREWATDILTDVIDQQIGTFCSETGLFDEQTVRGQLKKLNQGDKNYTNNIWTVFFVINWVNKWFR